MVLPNGLILFADENADDRFLMIEACKEAGLQDRLAVVDDGEDVIAYLEKAAKSHELLPGQLRLIILDLNMSRKNGFETLEWIRKSQRWLHVPVLILTGSALPSDIRKASLLGANAVMVKPTTARELMELVVAIKNFWLRFVESSE